MINNKNDKPVKQAALYCSFCGKHQDDVRKLVAGPSVYICDECVSLCNDILTEELEFKSKEQKKGKLLTPQEIKDHLDQYIIGQDHAKKILSVAVHNHYKRIEKDGTAPGNSIEIQKSNILLLGPTGSGKTLLAQTLAKLLDVPFTIADATNLTEAGYVGEDVENIISNLLQAADYDVERAQRGIIYIDEIDKISRKSESPSVTRDVSGEGVQQALLKIIEGTVAHVPPKGGRKHPQQEMLDIDTTNILFICGGAFAGLETIINKRLGSNKIGFGDNVINIVEHKQNVFSEVETKDLLSYGLIPELIGRLPIVATLSELNEDDLVRVLLEPKNALIKQYQQLFSYSKVQLTFTTEAIKEIAHMATKRSCGARGLRAIIENAMLDTMFDIPGQKDAREVIISDQVIAGTEKPAVILESQVANH